MRTHHDPDRHPDRPLAAVPAPGAGPDTRVLVLSGSTRRDSVNTRLARLVARALPAATVSVVADLDRLPFYDGDVEAQGVPAPVAALREAVAAHDLVVVVTPEYNGAVPGLLGNTVDWLSRPHGESVLRGVPVVVLSASPTPYGGARAAEQLRALLGRLGAEVSPAGLSVGRAHQRLGGPEADPELLSELAAVLDPRADEQLRASA